MTSTNDSGARRGALCATCGAASAVEAYAPFCSKRCADIDLHRWLSEGYAIPASGGDDEDPILDEEEEPGAA